ncbi:hypothetical protein C8J27_101554 [Rhodobacter aestuarii]|uniref:Uncharacterized protein n=1 Tax=Rhodobacter aestuarii TaxID=453582 RepID=A0A1N7IXE3_9RHOB|nr:MULTISPECIES: DUF6447 family protein [Rhodobacter]PTV97439.1 hypothetical protein C8J27_101554 [Rhodobacter aestuarii]SIS41667.1 hypothetical protein SAMN05421580_10188 [Rhodobacter aestuarii]SOC00532.1 hypothetical protein SAMN05877809_102634 [Rhodobacter sp. JA431]
MPRIKIEDLDFNSEDLSDLGKAHLANLDFVEKQLRRLQGEVLAFQTARQTYLAALKAEVAKTAAVKG